MWSVVSYCNMAEFIILSYYFRLCISGRKANGTLTVYLTSNSQPANYTVFKGAARMVWTSGSYEENGHTHTHTAKSTDECLKCGVPVDNV